MNKTPPALSLGEAYKLPWRPGHSAEVLIDGELELRFTPKPNLGAQTPHTRDELYIIASGTGHYRVEDTVTAFGPGDLLFAAAHTPHGFEDYSDNFALWVIFYGPKK